MSRDAWGNTLMPKVKTHVTTVGIPLRDQGKHVDGGSTQVDRTTNRPNFVDNGSLSQTGDHYGKTKA